MIAPQSRRPLLLAGAGSLALYLLYFYVPISAAHTVAINHFRPLSDWAIDSPAGLSLYFAGIVTGLFGLYFAAWRRVRSTGDASPSIRRLVYGTAAAAAIVLMFLPSLLSKDVFDYMVQGRILAIYHSNPFQTTAQAFVPDDFVRAMGWPQFTSLYGPVWVSAAGILAFISPNTLGGSILVYKILFAAVHLLNGALIGTLLRGWGKPALQGELLYLWNPLILLTVAGDAHNDGFLMMWVLLGLLFLDRGNRWAGSFEEMLGAVCLAVSILIKYVSAPFLGFAMIVRLRDRGFLRAISLAVIACVVFILGYLPYLKGMDPRNLFRPYQMGHYQGGLLMVLSMALSRVWPSEVSGSLSDPAGRAMVWISLALTAALALWALSLLLRARQDADLPRLGLLVLLPYLLVVTALLRVSYGVWIVSLAALIAPGPLRRAALLFSASLMTLNLYWVYAVRMSGSPLSLHRQQAVATLVAVGVPILYLLLSRVAAGRDAAARSRSASPGER